MATEVPFQNNDSPIVKCSHCQQILPIEDFNTHNCKWLLRTVKRIPVAFFRDDSFDDETIMTGYGLDGVLYTFVVTPRTAIPYFRKLADEKKQQPRTDEEGTVSAKKMFNRFSS